MAHRQHLATARGLDDSTALSSLGVDWISPLRAPQIRRLATDGAFQLSLFDEQDLAEVAHPSFPGERLVVCRNPLLAAERRRKRNEMLDATEAKLAAIERATRRESRALTGKAKIGVRIGRVLERSKMGKHFAIQIADDVLSFQRDEDSIRKETELDGI